MWVIQYCTTTGILRYPSPGVVGTFRQDYLMKGAPS